MTHDGAQVPRPRLPPRWFIRAAWTAHRAICAISRGRLGLSKANPGQIGMLRLRTTGRRTGRDRRAILGYLADGRDFILVAMNGWGAAEPAWWLNLQSRPEAVVELPRESIPVVGREALGEERSRLWKRIGFLGRDMEPYAALRPRPTAIVVLESRTSTGPERGRD